MVKYLRMHADAIKNCPFSGGVSAALSEYKSNTTERYTAYKIWNYSIRGTKKRGELCTNCEQMPYDP
jgi:hypothetical protein